RRSDAVRQRAQDEKAMLAATSAADRKRIQALAEVLAAASANRERDLLLGLVASQTQLLRAALQLERLRIESARPDAERAKGFQARDVALIEGMLRQVQRRFDPQVEKALLRELLGRYLALPQAQRVPEFDEAFGRTPAEVEQTLERLYAATGLG